MTDTTDIARRVSMTDNGDTYEIWLDANRYHYRTDGFAVLMLEGMNHSYPRRVQSAAIKAALKAIVELHGELEAERQRAAGSEEELHKALHREKAAERKLLAAREEIAELKAKLANPVVLEYRKHDGFTDPEKARLINAVTDRCAGAIKESGFTVKDGQ